MPGRLCVLMLLLALQLAALSGRAAAADEKPPAAAVPESALETAPVEIDGRVLFRVRGASSYPAAQRAGAIAERIEKVAADRSFRTADLRVEDLDGGSAIMAGDEVVMAVFDSDARMEHLSRQRLADLHLKRIAQAIDDYRLLRGSDALLRGALYAAGASIALAAGLALLFWVGRRLENRLSQRLKSRIHTVGIQSFEIVRAEHIWQALHGVLYGLRIVLMLVLCLIYLQVVLSLFPWTRGLAGELLGLVSSALGSLGKGVASRIPDLIIVVVIYYLFRFLLRVLHHFFEAVERKTVTLKGFEAEWAVPTYKLVRLAIIAFGLIVAYPYIPGSQSAAFKGISLFVGVVFSLGSSTAVSNIIAGYLMTYRRVFKVGDRVKVGEVVGDVMAIRLQVTHLLTPKNEEVTVPNSQILNGDVVNFTSQAGSRGLILHTTVGIGYETPWRQVEAMLLKAASRTKGVLGEPSPYILIKALADFAVTYELNVYSGNPQQMNEDYTELHRQILDVFNEYGVQIMTPAYVADTPEPKLVPRDQWHAAPAAPVEGGKERPG
ncbi:MAG TPA: mechanosensitive ion channel family protein [Geomonas sp.]|nr:mechanosensitive ion channel family protein [Geomonas sp.]